MGKIENTQVSSFGTAIIGARNPMTVDITAQSPLTDSYTYYGDDINGNRYAYNKMMEVVNSYHNFLEQKGLEHPLSAIRNPEDWLTKNSRIGGDPSYPMGEYFYLGAKDADLCRRLIKSGPEHCKFLRQIYVVADIYMPSFWWREMDRYKIGTDTNSSSTMHKVLAKPFTLDQFAYTERVLIDNGEGTEVEEKYWYYNDEMWDHLLRDLNDLRNRYLDTQDKKYWRAIIELLPQSWMYRRTWSGSYMILRAMYHQRKGHKLAEWEEVRSWIRSLPYADIFITDELWDKV